MGSPISGPAFERASPHLPSTLIVLRALEDWDLALGINLS